MTSNRIQPRRPGAVCQRCLALATACGLAAPATPAAAQLTEPFPAVFDLHSLAPWAGGDGSLGFIITGQELDQLGWSVAPAGDVNGDGVGDLIIGAPRADADERRFAGVAYVIFGRRGGGFAPEFDLSQLDGSNGFRIIGAARGDRAGSSVAGAGDVNGDGIDDIIIGSPSADPGGLLAAGRASVVFGRAGAFSAEVDLATLDGSNGFHIDGASTYDYTGYAVAAAGDVNGDALGDVVVGAKNGAVWGAYVVFGRSGGFPASIPASTVSGPAGFRVQRWSGGSYAGVAVAGAGDVNGDGLDDIVIGTPDWYEDKYLWSRYFDDGDSYIVFGSRTSRAIIDLHALDGEDGFRLRGFGDLGAGFSVAMMDVNADGLTDIVTGAPGGWEEDGEASVVMGRGWGFPPVIDLASLAPPDGFKLLGGEASASGAAVGSAGDVNGDGFLDVLVAAPYTSMTHVVFGTDEPLPPVIELASLDGENGFTLIGAGGDGPQHGNGQAVGSVGDINGDGAGDLAVAAGCYVGGLLGPGRVFIVFGRTPDAPCYADCDGSGELDFFDFLCFQNLFAAGDPRADCDDSGELDFFDFLCFQNAFAAGCP